MHGVLVKQPQLILKEGYEGHVCVKYIYVKNSFLFTSRKGEPSEVDIQSRKHQQPEHRFRRWMDSAEMISKTPNCVVITHGYSISK